MYILSKGFLQLAGDAAARYETIKSDAGEIRSQTGSSRCSFSRILSRILLIKLNMAMCLGRNRSEKKIVDLAGGSQWDDNLNLLKYR